MGNFVISIPGYEIDKKIGSGGMADVYLGHQISVDRPVAIKIMSSALAVDETFAKRFVKEANVGSLSHQNIITVYDAGKIEDNHYIIMEYIDGGDLATLIAKNSLTFEQKITIVKQIAVALGYSYSKGFIHRDVKPENILFREDGTPVLADFGIAKALSAATNLTSVGTAIGSPFYMSPEQTRGQEVDHRSDLYSLGVVFYELLCGYKPFESGDTYAIGIKHISEAIPPLPQPLAQYQPLLDTMLAKDPSQRYQSSEQFVNAIEMAMGIGGATVIQPVVISAEPLKRKDSGNNTGKRIKKGTKKNTIKGKKKGKKKDNKIVLLLMVVAALFSIAGGVTFYFKGKEIQIISSAGQQQDSQSKKTSELTLQIEKKLFLAEQLALHVSNDLGKREELIKIFREVLVLDETNQAATLGLEMAAALYMDEAQDNFNNKNTEVAKELLEKSLDLIETREGLELQKSITKYEAQLQISHSQATKYEIKQEQAVQLNSKEQVFKQLTSKPPVTSTIESEKQIQASQRAVKINSLLQKANLRLGQNKLIQPTNDNAYYYYQQVLKADTRNQNAKSGLENITVALELDLHKALKGKRFTYIEERSKQLLDYPEFVEIATSYTQKIRELRERSVPLNQNETQDKLIGGGKGPVMVKVSAGSFLMGDIQGTDTEGDEKPVHQVDIKQSFAIGKYEVTFVQYDIFAKTTGRTLPADNGYGRGDRPVINVSWNDAKAYTYWLSKQTGKVYRLPTEAEWEYAARGDTQTDYYWGNSVGRKNANCYGCSGGFDNKGTAEVGRYQANGIGIFDMHGNVWEWVQDCWHDRYDGAPQDGAAWEENGCDARVLRGGSWKNYPLFIRASNRDWYEPNRSSNQFGFRVVRQN